MKKFSVRDLKTRKEKLPEHELPCLTDKQIKVFTKKLLKQVEIFPEFKLPVWKILIKVQELIEKEGLSTQNFLRCVGSAHEDVIHSDPEYLKTVLEKISRKAVDITLRRFLTDPKEDDMRDLDIRISS